MFNMQNTFIPPPHGVRQEPPLSCTGDFGPPRREISKTWLESSVVFVERKKKPISDIRPGTLCKILTCY